jgi:hypothetical protein
MTAMLSGIEVDAQCFPEAEGQRQDGGDAFSVFEVRQTEHSAWP